MIKMLEQMNCKVCNDEFEHSFGYDEEHCDEWCARSTNPNIEGFHRTQLNKPKQSIFNYYINAFKSRSKSVELKESEERILKSAEYIRIRMRFQEDEDTNAQFNRVKA